MVQLESEAGMQDRLLSWLWLFLFSSGPLIFAGFFHGGTRRAPVT